uniref:Capsid protein n=1 Tax=Nanhai ghost shark astrovirus 1 TaxID=2116331 RepID=A0A2P1GNH2_9VIRU|nr:capsid protein [Nanhai ghost shark astrovirus 1]
MEAVGPKMIMVKGAKSKSKSKKPKARPRRPPSKETSRGKRTASWTGTVFLGHVHGNPTSAMKLVHMLHTNPLFCREDDPRVGSQATPLTTVAAIHQRYRLVKCDVELVSLVGNNTYEGSVLYVWRNDTPGIITAQPSLDALLATSPVKVGLGLHRKIKMPGTRWLDINTSAAETQKWEDYTVQVYISGTTKASFYKSDTPYDGDLWMVYVHVSYDFQEVRPTGLSVLSTRDTDTVGTKVVTMPSTSEAPGALALEVNASSQLHCVLNGFGGANALTSGQANAIWEIGDMAVTVAASFLGSFGWILQGGWFVIKRHFGKRTSRATLSHWLIYPSLVQAQQDNYVTGAPGQDVGSVTGKISVQQLTNPNFSGDPSTAFGSSGVPLGYPLVLPNTSDLPPILQNLPGQVQVSAKTNAAHSVLPVTQTGTVYEWKFDYRLSMTAWEEFPTSGVKPAFHANSAEAFASIEGTETVVTTIFDPTDDQTAFSVIWKGSLYKLVDYAVVRDATVWRSKINGVVVHQGLMFPFYTAGQTWEEGRPIIGGCVWLFVGRKDTVDIASSWAGVFVVPGTSGWASKLSDKWTMHNGFSGPTVLVLGSSLSKHKSRLAQELESLQRRLQELLDMTDSEEEAEETCSQASFEELESEERFYGAEFTVVRSEGRRFLVSQDNRLRLPFGDVE